MKTLIAIPSKDRAELFAKCTFSWLRLSELDFMVFVEPQDAEAYRKITNKVVVLPENDQGLGYAKLGISAYARTHGYDLIFKMDDDVIGWAGKDRKLVKENSHLVVQQILNDSEEVFSKYEDVAAISFPYRWEMYEKKKWVSINSRLQTCYLIKTGDFFASSLISTFEDFAQYMYLRLNNRSVVRYGWAGIDCKDVGTTQGGLMNFDRDLMAMEEIKILRNMYPPLEVKTVEGKRWSIEPVLRGGIFKSKKI